MKESREWRKENADKKNELAILIVGKYNRKKDQKKQKIGAIKKAKKLNSYEKMK